MLTYGSVCSGIESASMAWEPIGLSPLWFSEVEPFPCAVLSHRWPSVPNLGDMTALAKHVRIGAIPAPDLLVGGTPCQAFSVAGVRKGLSDERGQLTICFGDLANAIDEQREDGDECVITWENVPGVLSDKTNAFGCFLGLLAGEDVPLEPTGKRWPNAGCVIGPQRTVAWRVIDAQYFGLAQRRKRVFVVASARDGFDPLKVLFESEGVRRDTPPSREAQENAARDTSARFRGYEESVGTLMARDYKGVGNQFVEEGKLVVGALDTQCGFEKVADQSVRPVLAGHIVGTLTARGLQALGARDVEEGMVRVQGPVIGRSDTAGPQGSGFNVETCFTLNTTDRHAVNQASKVRKLTPIECERLQGFPDNHTRIPYRNKPEDDCPDGPRYKAIGNSKAVPCIRFVGLRIVKEWFRCY